MITFGSEADIFNFILLMYLSHILNIYKNNLDTESWYGIIAILSLTPPTGAALQNHARYYVENR
jgi:hypothetical protein